MVVSFWDYDFDRMHPGLPACINYEETLGSRVTWQTYLQHAEVLPRSSGRSPLLIGFSVAYFLAFHVRTHDHADGAVPGLHRPVLTSNIIRMISWIPFLGRNGLVNYDADAARA